MTDFAQFLAVVIGIDVYTGSIPLLATAVNDATRLAVQHCYETLFLTEPATG